MFVKRKTSRPTRERFLDDDNEDDDETKAEDSPSTLASKIKKRSKPKVKSRLSFGGEEDKEEDSFKIKKSNLRANLVMGDGGVISNASSNGSPLRQSIMATSSVSNQDRPTYSREYLSELKAATPSAATRPEPPAEFDIDGAVVEYSEDLGVEGSDIGQESIIPTQHSIEAARSKRNQLRANPELQQQAEDFVSLEVSTHVSTRERESRLVREEDEIGDAEDELAEYTGATERIALGKKNRQAEKNRIKMGVAEMIEDVQIEDDDDEESREWEREQIRRATSQLERQDISGKPKVVYKPTPIPPPTPLPILGPAIARLTTTLSNLTTSHSTTTETLTNLASEREALEEKEVGLRSLVAETDSKRAWFEEMSGKVDDLGAFLDVKFPALEEIEKEHLSYTREKSEMVERKMMLEDVDDLSIFFGIPEVPTKLKKENAEEDDSDPKDEEDEMSASAQRQRFVVRQERYERRTNTRVACGKAVEDGYESSASLAEYIISDFQDALSRLNEKVEKLMSDVHAKDYKDPSKGIARWFADWRSTYRDSYQDAWGGLGLVAAWEFWARLECCGWDPISSSKPLDTFKWFSSLYSYSHNHGAGDDGGETAPQHEEEQDLANAMVATMFAPKLCAFIENGALNPYSTKHVRRLVELCEEVEVYVPKDDIKHKAILQATYHSFRKAIDSTASLVQSSLESTKPLVRGVSPYPTPEVARKRTLNRRFKLLQNLLLWRKYASDVYGVGNLVGQVVERILAPIMEKMGEVEVNVLKRKLQDIVPSELLPRF